MSVFFLICSTILACQPSYVLDDNLYEPCANLPRVEIGDFDATDGLGVSVNQTLALFDFDSTYQVVWEGTAPKEWDLWRLVPTAAPSAYLLDGTGAVECKDTLQIEVPSRFETLEGGVFDQASILISVTADGTRALWTGEEPITLAEQQIVDLEAALLTNRGEVRENVVGAQLGLEFSATNHVVDIFLGAHWTSTDLQGASQVALGLATPQQADE